MKHLVMMIVAAAVCSGCATSAARCKFDEPYLQSKGVGPLVHPEGGSLPANVPGYDIPPIPKSEISLTRSGRNADGEEVLECLDRPPRMTPPPSNAS